MERWANWEVHTLNMLFYFILFWLIVSRSKYIRFLQISNFEYLMELNTLAGRSYNDITQVNLIHKMQFKS
jgi:hypothetical protein